MSPFQGRAALRTSSMMIEEANSIVQDVAPKIGKIEARENNCRAADKSHQTCQSIT